MKPEQDLRIVSTRVLTGPNVFAPLPLVRLELALGRYAQATLASLGEGFRRNAIALLPSIGEGAGNDSHDPFHAPGSGFAWLIGEIALDLQRHLGAEVRHCRAEPVSPAGVCAVQYALWDDEVARRAAGLAVDLLLRLMSVSASAGPWSAAQEREQVLKRLRPHALDLITMAMVRAAVGRDIPWYRLVPRKQFVQLGQGARQKHIRESASTHTSSTGRYLSKDKNATNALLARIGIPVPPQRLVTSVEEAVEAAAALGFPVVTKPLDRGNGKGVSVGLQHADAVRWGFSEAAKYGDEVIVERFVAGEDHRILVVDGRMVAAAKRIPGHVVGDGERTIAQLVELINADPRRGTEYDQVMVRLEFDAQAAQVLGEAGLTRESIPARGEVVPLRRTANVSTGGTCEDVTERIHPDNRDAAIRASRVLGLNVAGADFLSTDITRSYREIGGGICEVNFSPGLRPHWNANPERDVVGPILETMFPPGAESRIPIAAVIGGSAGGVCRLLAHVLACPGRHVGLATAEGVEIDGRLLASGDMTGPGGASALLLDPSVDAAILECSLPALITHGLTVDRCDVAAVLPASARTGRGREERAAMGILIGAAKTAVVLDPDDPDYPGWSSGLTPERLILAGARVPNERLAAHRAAGGRALTLSGANKDLALEAHAGDRRLWALPRAEIPLLHAARPDAAGILCAAAALALGLGVEAERLLAALRSQPPQH